MDQCERPTAKGNDNSDSTSAAQRPKGPARTELQATEEMGGKGTLKIESLTYSFLSD